MKVDVLVLAGGKSRRMGGTHKGSLKLGDDTFQGNLIKELSEISEQIFLSYGVTVHCEDARCRILMDEVPDCGPLGGLVSGLKYGEQEFTAVSACDLPYMKASFYEALLKYLRERELVEGHEYKGIVPVLDSRIHPLTAIYRKSAHSDFEKEFQEKHFKVTRIVESMDILFMDLGDQKELALMLKNINTPEEYQSVVADNALYNCRERLK